MAECKFHTLETITMADFEKIYFGDLSKVVASGRCDDEAKMQKACAELIERYISIVGGGGISAELSKRNNRVKLEMRLAVIEAARLLADARMYEDACKVMASLGYRLDAKNKEAVHKRIMGVKAQTEYRLQQYRDAEKQEDDAEPDKDYFVKERVAVMRWAKMQIEPNTIKAIEYAYLIQAMSEEAKMQQRELDKMKHKK